MGVVPVCPLLVFLLGTGFFGERPKNRPAAEIRRESGRVCAPEVLSQRLQMLPTRNWIKRRNVSGPQRICGRHSNASHRPYCRRNIDRGSSVATASAADISAGLNVNGNFYSPVVARIEPVIVFDYEPGVIVRTSVAFRLG